MGTAAQVPLETPGTPRLPSPLQTRDAFQTSGLGGSSYPGCQVSLGARSIRGGGQAALSLCSLPWPARPCTWSLGDPAFQEEEKTSIVSQLQGQLEESLQEERR